jgi:hypothetical protein
MDCPDGLEHENDECLLLQENRQPFQAYFPDDLDLEPSDKSDEVSEFLLFLLASLDEFFLVLFFLETGGADAPSSDEKRRESSLGTFLAFFQVAPAAASWNTSQRGIHVHPGRI